MTIRILFFLSTILPIISSAQNIEILVYEQDIQLESLIPDRPSFLSGFAEIFNKSGESLTISVTTEAIEFPSGWSVDESILRSEDNSYEIQSGNAFNLSIYMDFFILDYTTAFDKGIQTFRVVATKSDGTEVYNDTFDFCYSSSSHFVPPSPTFSLQIYPDTLAADTLYVPIHILDPFEQTFNGYIEERYFEDHWFLERYIALEPIEIISENVLGLRCEFNTDPMNPTFDKDLCNGDTILLESYNLDFMQLEGQFMLGSEFRFEMLVNIYDPVDSLNSNQKMRFIMLDESCINGTETNLVNSERDIFLCQGEDITLEANPQYPSLDWEITSTGEKFTGNSFTLTDIQNSTSIYVTSRDAAGCLLFNYYNIQIEIKYEELIDDGNMQLELCPGEDLQLTIFSNYTNVIWLDQNTGNTFIGNELLLSNVTQDLFIEIQAINSEGCKVRDHVFVFVNPEGKLANIFPDGENYLLCHGGSLTLEANPIYKEVVWHNTATGETTSGNIIELVDVQESVYIEVRAKGDGVCDYFQNLFINPDYPQWNSELITSHDYFLCRNSDLTISASDAFTEIYWIDHRTGETIVSDNLVLTNIIENIFFDVYGRGLDGCIYQSGISIIINEDGIEDNNILATDLSQNFCRKITLTAADGYFDYEWLVFDNEITFDYVLVSTEKEVQLDYTDKLGWVAPLLLLQAKDADGCRIYYNFEFGIGEPEPTELLDLSEVGSYCEGDLITLKVSGNYDFYEWYYQGQTYNTPTLTIPASNDQVSLVVLDKDGCTFLDEFYAALDKIEPPYLCLITNEDGTKNNKLLWEDPINNSNISEYLIYRESSSAGDYELIGTNDAKKENSFIDKDSDSGQQAYRYHIKSKNICDNTSLASNEHKTIHLTINQGANENINLIWDTYIGVQYSQVKILRGDSPNNLQDYVELTSNATSFTDQNPPSGDVYYQLELAIEIECKISKAIFFVRSNVAEILKGNGIDEIGLTGKIYPNPFKNEISIQLANKAQLEIITLEGLILKNQLLEEGTHTIPTEDLIQGAYLIRVNTGHKIYAQHFIKT